MLKRTILDAKRNLKKAYFAGRTKRIGCVEKKNTQTI